MVQPAGSAGDAGQYFWCYGNPHSPVPEPERFFGRKKQGTYTLITPSTKHLAVGLLELRSIGGLIDWYLYVKEVPYPSLDVDNRAKLLGAFHLQGGGEMGFLKSFFFFKNLFCHSRFLIVPTDFSRVNFFSWVGQQSRRARNKGTATIGIVVLDGTKIHIFGTSSNVFHSKKTIAPFYWLLWVLVALRAPVF